MRKRGKGTMSRQARLDKRRNIPNKLVQMLSPYVPTFQDHLEKQRAVTATLRGRQITVDRWFLELDKTQPDPIFDEHIKESLHGKKESKRVQGRDAETEAEKADAHESA